MERYICIHGHFYQPPRENPWLEDIELQDSAYPYHDWNERISAECYAPNAASRILDGEGRIINIPNNYSRISFNFGPTLLAWMAVKDPDTYQSVLLADQISQQHFSGHGSALAQVYNHPIMPLANRRDKTTQVRWGIGDFRHRFGRDPEGMWLAETAADLETLDIMAEEGLRFTIRPPRQAARTRPGGADEWDDVSGERIDPTRPYLQRLPSGRSMPLFFYDGPVSRTVAFERVLDREDYHFREAGQAKLGLGRIRIASEITRNEDRISLAVLHFGDHNIAGGVRSFQGSENYGAMVREISETFERADFPETIRRIDLHFGEATYSLRSLFRDEQRKVLNQIMETSLEEIRGSYRQIYNHHGPLMRFLIDLGAPLPNAYRATAELVLNANIRVALDAEEPDGNAVSALLNEARLLQISLDHTGLEYALRNKVFRLAREFQAAPGQLQRLVRLNEAVDLARKLPFQVNLWKVQNLFYEALHTVYPEWRWKADQGRKKAQQWVRFFREIGEKLSLRVE